MMDDDAMGNIVEEALEIDMERINEDASKEAEDMIKTISDLYADKDFLAKHPKIAARIKLELDTLRVHIKERKAAEEMHDSIIAALSSRRDNASLYRALTDQMKATIALSDKIHDTMERLDKICKDAHAINETPMQTSDNDGEIETNIHRGSKSFIRQLLEQGDTLIEENE